MQLISAKFEREGGCKCDHISAKSVKRQLSKKGARAAVLPGPRQAQLVPMGLQVPGQSVNTRWSAWPCWSRHILSGGSTEKVWMRKINFYWVWWRNRSGRERSLGNQEKYLKELLACKSYLFLALFGVYFLVIVFFFFCFVITVFMLFFRFL